MSNTPEIKIPTSLAITENTPIIYSFNPETLKELRQDQEFILSKVTDNIEDLEIQGVKKAKRKVAKLRVITEKERKQLKAAALSYGKLVDSTAADVQKPVIEIEGVYDKLITEYDAHFAELARIATEKENARVATIEGRIEDFCSFKDRVTYNTTATEVKSIITDFDEAFVEKFDYAEFKDKAIEAAEHTIEFLRTKFKERVAYEAEEAGREAQRKIDEENRRKLKAEQAEFETKQKEAQAEIDAERATIQKEKDDLQQAENERAQEKQRQVELLKLQEEREELELQRAVEAKKRKEAEEKEKFRLIAIEGENEARKIAQEKEDRIRNAAPKMLKILKQILDEQSYLDQDKQHFEYEIAEGNEQIIPFYEAWKLIKLVKGE